MTLNEYQKLAMTTLNPALEKKDVLINGVMGLCGESGEAIDIVKKWLAQGHQGTVVLFGCPAEEGGGGKAYMAREGCFDGVDVVPSSVGNHLL